MSPSPHRSSQRDSNLREDFGRLDEKLEAVGQRAEEAKRASERYAVDTHRLIESVREDVRALGERMATAEQVRRLEEHVRRVDEGLVAVDKRVTAQASVVDAVPKLAERMDDLEDRVAEQDAQVKSIPDLAARMTAVEHRASRTGGALWVVGAIVALLGLAGIRELSRWFVQVPPPAPVRVEEPALPTRRRP